MRHAATLAALLALGCSTDPNGTVIVDGGIAPQCVDAGGPGAATGIYSRGQCLFECRTDAPWVTCGNDAGIGCGVRLDTVENCGDCDRRCPEPAARCVDLTPDAGVWVGNKRFVCR